MFENNYYHIQNNQEENQPSWMIDYLTVTIWAHDFDDVVDFINFCIKGIFTELDDQGHGGRFYRDTYKSDFNITLRLNPIGSEQDKKRVTLELPGKACQILGYEKLKDLLITFNDYFPKIKVNRIDTAFNHCPFTVQQVENCIAEENLRSYAKRESVRIFKQPYEKVTNENKEVVQEGTSGLYFGSRSSTRMIRVYDKHGYTRVEAEYKHEKAHQIAFDVLLSKDENEALRMALGHLRDYVDFFEEWWSYFIQNYDRLYKQLPQTVKEMTVERIKIWFEKQIAAAFYVLGTVEGPEAANNLYWLGKKKYDKSRYSGILELETEYTK